jgi:amino acid adenylation domain-containing protein
MTGYKNFIEVCESTCTRYGPKLAYRYFHGPRQEEESLSFAALRENAIALATRLQRVGEPGDRVLIICPQSMDYVRALWGCLYSGLVAVPAYAPRNSHHFERLRTIVHNAQAKIVLLNKRQLRSVRESGILFSIQWITIDEPVSDGRIAAIGPRAWTPPPVKAEHLALLQYTSGSTTAARGVMVSHQNLLANQEMIKRAFCHRSDTISVLWIPLFHDMGLMGLLQGVYVGFSSHLMSPLDFLTCPNRWLRAISDLKATATAAPDFGYRMCVDKVTNEQLVDLDFTNLETAINGSEPISAKNLDDFAKRFAPCGFRREAFFPSYGLAEATLLVSGRRHRGMPRLVAHSLAGAGESSHEVERVACGLPAHGCEVRVVDEQGRPCAPHQVGEIWVKGANVASGYWNNELATKETFGATTVDGAGPFLRTGDLGFVQEGDIVVTGRLKDLIIVRGVNYYPNDIEETSTASHAQLVPNGCAVFVTTRGELCVVAEVKGASLVNQVEAAIAGAVSEVYGLSVDRVVLVKPGTIPRTSSGKIQRNVTKQALEEDTLKVIHTSAFGTESGGTEATELQRFLAEADENARPEILERFLLSHLANQLNVPVYRLPRQKSVLALGLDSIALIRLKQKLESELSVELPAEMFFADRTAEKLSEEIIRAWKNGLRQYSAPSVQTTLSGSYAATIGQVALWALQQRDPGVTSYNEGFVGWIEGPLDLACLQRSLQVLVERHPALRITFRETNGQLWQDVSASFTVQLRIEAVEAPGQALATAQAVIDSPFDLERETWRCRLIQGTNETYLSFAVHHIVFDLWSFGIFFEELSATYRAILEGSPLPFPPLDQSSAWLDHTRAQTDRALSGREYAYWREALADAPPTSRFPPSLLSARPASCAANRRRFVLPRSSLAELGELAQTENLTLHQVLLSAFFLLLSKYSDQDDLVIGIPLLGRSRHDSLGTLGYFVNLAPVRLHGIDQTDIFGLMKQTQRVLKDVQQCQAIPFAKLVEEWGPGGGGSWVQTSFSMLSPQLTGRPELAPFILGMAGGRIQLGSTVLHSCSHDRRQAQFDLACTVIEWEGELHGYVEVRDGLYDEGMIDRLIENYLSLLRATARSGRTKTRFVSVVSENEQQLLRQHLRRGQMKSRLSEAGPDANVVGWFRRATSQHGAHIALLGPTSKRSYAEMEEETDRIARALIERSLKRGDRIGLAFSDRTLQTVAALSVLKAAGTFVPLDLGHPSQRLSFCVRDSQTAAILTDDKSASHISHIAQQEGVNIFLLRELAVTPATNASAISLPGPARSEDIAYCIYTSGSTGMPKGVSVPHRGLQNLIQWHLEAFDVNSSARASLIAGPAFDVAVWEVWPYLCAGGTLVEPPPEVNTVAGDLARWIRDQRLTHSFIPTALVELLLEGHNPPDLGELRYLLTAGDRLRIAPRSDSSFQLINAYGPTENSVITTAGSVAAVGVGNGLPDIGEPISSQDLYILDRHGNEVPVGVCGELYISGKGLAREYHRRPALTAERFVPNPFAREPGGRIYASGDLVRLAEDGRINFVGRNDDQVKIRGQRLELGEIEAVLMRHPAVEQCKVALQESPETGKWIAAYLRPTLEADGPEAEADVRGWLEEHLPRHMVPRAFQWLAELPVDSNGKIDKKQLPPCVDPRGEQRPSTPFKAPFEEDVAQLYEEIVGAPRVARDDDFFALGGHSLMAGKLVQRVHTKLGMRIAMADLFTHPRVHQLAAFLHANQEPRIGCRMEPISRPAFVPLSSAQGRLWFLQRLDPQSTDYNISAVLHIRGYVDLPALEFAIQQVVARHEALRSRFPERAGTPYQDVMPSQDVPLECVNFDLLDSQECHEAVRQTLRAWESEPFSLEDGPLLRTRLLRTATAEGWFFFSVHHIVADARSLQILMREISSLYQNARSGQQKKGLPPVLQYVDYTLSCLSDEFQKKEASDLHYWKDHLAELPPKLSIPSLAPPTSGEVGFRGDEVWVPLPTSLVNQVRSCAAAWNTTEFSVYLATLTLLLGKTTGEDRFLVGIAYHGRNLPELQGVVGFFVNVLPILVESQGRRDFHGLLDLIRAHCAEAMEHSHASYENIVHCLCPRREGAEMDLIQVMFDFEQITPERVDLHPAQAVVTQRADTSAKFDLTLHCRLGSNDSVISLNYRKQRYSRVLVESLLSSYIVLLRQIFANPKVMLADLQLVDDTTAVRLLQKGAGPKRPPASDSIVQRFESIAHAYPGRLALVAPNESGGEEEHLTYGALNVRANSLAHVLRDAGLVPGAIGAVCLPSSPSFVVCALAILKLGAAYTAIDPTYPAKRRRAILDDCQARLLVTDYDAQPTEAPPSGSVLSWSSLVQRAKSHSAANLKVRPTAEDPVYLVYTSGTTGAPKGIVIQQRALVNLCQWHAHTYGLEGRGKEIRAGQTASISFDAAVWEIWPYLLEGASVWFAPRRARTSSREMARWLTETRITHVFLATPLANELIGDGWQGSADLEFLLTGGDRLTRWAVKDADYQLFNHYGPSENTVVATAGRVASTGARLPSIGRPIDNVQALLLDRDRQLLPEGVAGELYLAGSSLSGGYRGDPESTEQRWVLPSFATDSTRLYRTGDRVCWNENDELEYLGRVDDQVKIRGFRIEPAEIVQVLTAHPDVQSALVKAVKHPVTGLHLAAYVVLRPGATTEVRDLQNELAKTLPAFMTPSFLLLLNAFPLTSNGKVDLARLPAPRWDAESPDRPLATPTERAIGAIWSDLLCTPVESAEANFFALGGHSLLAARAVAAIESELARECTLRTFLASSTLAELAEKVDTGTEYLRIPKAKLGQKHPLSPLQRRLWLVQQFAPENADYNVVGAIQLEGFIDALSLKRAVARLIERHAVLRTQIKTVDGEPYQEVLSAAAVEEAFLSQVFTWEDLRLYSSREQEAHLAERIAVLGREAYDLQRGPLFRLSGLQFEDSRVGVAVSIHHIMVDGWSVQVLLRDLFEIYRSLVDGQALDLPTLSVDYCDYSVWAVEQLSLKEHELVSFWRGYLRDRPAPALLPSRQRPQVEARMGETWSVGLGGEISARLYAFARNQRVSLFELLFATHVVWLYQLTRSTDLIVAAPFHQRGRPELENLAGFFVNILPVRSRFSRFWAFRQLLEQVHEEVTSVQAHYELPFERIAEYAGTGEESLYQTIFDLRQERPFEALIGNLSVKTLLQHLDAPIADLAVTLAQGEDGLTWSCTFRPERFSLDMIKSWAASFRLLIEGILEDVERPIRDLPCLRAEHPREPTPRRIASDSRPDDTLVLQLARRVATSPSLPALTAEEESFSFLDLELTTNQICHYLWAQGIRPGAPVGVEARHHLNSILTIIGVIKLGAFYVPIDTTLPVERLRELVGDAACEHFLSAGTPRLPGFSGQIIPMERERWRDLPRHLLGVSVIPEYPVYLAYTSGTTGQPKASVLSHRGISNYVSTVRDRFRITPKDRFLLFAPLSFDASLEEIFVPLCSGASLHIAPPESKSSVSALIELCRRAQITILILPTAYWRLLAEEIAAVGGSALPTVRLISIGGEKAPLPTVQKWTELTANRIELWNIYGPSECSVGCVVDRLEDVGVSNGIDFLPLRHAVENVELYVLDEHLDPVPPAVDGEVYVGGVGLAHGYYGRPALTAEKFVPNPFGEPGSRLYQTGDLVRMDRAGGMQFLGRTDFQVKIDGLRVEPGEVESALERHPDVTKAVVIPKRIGTADNHLVAYVTLRQGALEATPEALLAYLRCRLPSYMLPVALYVLEEFPLTANQKIDRAALSDHVTPVRERAPAESEMEEFLLSTWRQLLPDASIGVTDDLFSLGAGSLLVIRLITRIDVQTNIRLTVRDIFEHPTIRKLAPLVEQRQLHVKEIASSITRIDCIEVALSAAQTRLWYLQQIEKQSSAYHVPNCLRLEGPLRTDALLAAIRATIAENESLRTVFQVRGDSPMQIVQSDMSVELEEHDFGGLGLTEALARTGEFGRVLLELPFDLEQGPLCRFHLVRIQPELHIFVAIFHHIVIDGWSVELWNQRLTRAYNDPSSGKGGATSGDTKLKRALQYRDFSEWQRQRLDGGERDRQLAHWVKVLGGALPSLELPIDFVHPLQPSNRGDVRLFKVDGELAARLSSLARERQVSLFTVLFSAYFCLLHRYSNQTDILVGIPSLGRDQRELEGVIGFFVNTLVVRCRIHQDMPFLELLEQVKDTCLDAIDHQEIPLEEIAARVNAPRHGGRSELFQTMFSFHEGERTGAEGLRDLRVSNFEFPHRTSKFDLYLATWTTAEGLSGAIEFRTDLFASSTVDRMVEHFQNLLGEIVAKPSSSVARLQLLSRTEREELIRIQDGGVLKSRPDTLVHQLFEQQVEAHSDRCAVTCGSEKLTFAELNRRANLVAHKILHLGALPEDRVVLIFRRDAAYLVALLACLKSGTAFVPLDPNYPVAKRLSIVRHSAACFVVSESSNRHQIDEMDLDLPIVYLQDVLATSVGRDDPRVRNPNVPLTGNSLAYVMYTSGSTGTPKGVMIEHRGMLNHLLSKVEGLALSENDVVAEMAAITFDVSIWQYLVALLVGGRTLVIPGDAAWLPQQLLAEFEREGVTIFESVPSHMKVILDELESNPNTPPLSRLRTYISNAEALAPELCQRWLRHLPHVPIINTYGATECSDDTSHLIIDAPPLGKLPYIPIHGTLPNLTTYVLDERLEPVPMRVPGEIYIGGVGVGRGYLGDPVRTATVFVPDPFASEPGQRFYKTGDIGRLLPGGVLEFLGRADFQVKIRGQRVELGEIEATLRTHENVRDVLVSAANGQQGVLYLSAHIVPVRYPAPTAQELQAFVRARLPDHMVPAALVFMDEFPLNDNGKVDRKNLPTLSDEDLLHRHTYVPPSTDTERELAKLWGSLLVVDEVGVLDGFFELGGHSLLAAELMIKVRNRFGTEILLKEFFENPSVRNLGTLIDSRGGARLVSPQATIKRYPAKQAYDLAPCQIPEWYAYQVDPTSPVYNICVCDLFFRGNLDKRAFLRAWQSILDRHEVLHVRFGYRDGKPFQTVNERVLLSEQDVFCERLGLETDAEVLAEANRFASKLGTTPFDFENGPLFRLRLVTYNSNRHQLIFVVHHIIWDETSLINLTVELSELYNAFQEVREPELPVLNANYFDYVQWMHELLSSGSLEASKQYWLNLYESVPPPLDLPTDYPRPNLMSYRGDAIETWLPRRVVRKLESFLKRNEVTLFMLGLAVLDHYVYLMTGQDDFVIGCPIAGRSHLDFKPLLGLFATPLPIRCNIEAGMTFRDLLRHVSARTLDAFDHSQYPCNQLIEQLSHQKDLSRPKLFSVMFGVQNDKTDVVNRLSFRGLELSFEDVIETENKTSRFDLNFVVDQFGSDIKFSCIYNTDLFHRDTVALMLKNMGALLEAVLDDPDKRIHQYGGVSCAAETDHGMEAGPALAVDSRATMYTGLEYWAARTPSRQAVIMGDKTCTYQELNQRANRLAHYIRSKGIGPGTIAVLHEPSIEMVVSLYAVLKSGSCYVPIAPDYPQNRVDAILQDTGARAVLTTTQHEHRFSNLDSDLILVDDMAELLACYLPDDLPVVDPSALAYILYTSGTTGQPRGIQIEHRGVANMLAAMQHEYGLGADDCVLFHTPFTFDVAVQEIFWPLASGASVVVAPGHFLKAARQIASLIERESVTFVQFVPALLEALVAARRKGTISVLPSLRQVICGGAVLSKALNDGFRTMFSAPLANHYGPTEVTVDASRFDCRQPFIGDSTPIGRPVANTSIFVLNAERQRVPCGIIGDIYIASPGLARGYLNDEARTKEVFAEVEIDGARRRLYKTGDLGRFDRNGLLYFHGRTDKQIKVRGNRVETDEVAGVLASHPDIAAAAITYVKDEAEGGRLVAHIEQDPSINQLLTTRGLRYCFTFEQRPELIDAAEAWHRSRRAAFLGGDETIARLWPRLKHEFPSLQFLLTNNADEIEMVGYGVPLYLSEGDKDLSSDVAALGWSEALRRAFAQKAGIHRPNALYVFIGEWAPASDPIDVWSVLLDRQRELARAHGLKRIVYAHRPLSTPCESIPALVEWNRMPVGSDHPDPQLRAQIQHGGRAVGIVLDSFRVEATGCQWTEWTGAEVAKSGPALLPTTLQPVHVDLETNRWMYAEPCLLWMEELPPASHRRLPLNRASVREFLEQSLPGYMIPEGVHFLPAIPRTESGKIDERRLPDIRALPAAERRLAATQLQKELAVIMEQILGITVEIGVRDDFFVLGGQSLKAVQLISEINYQYSSHVDLREFYKEPTVEHLERLLARSSIEG